MIKEEDQYKKFNKEYLITRLFKHLSNKASRSDLDSKRTEAVIKESLDLFEQQIAELKFIGRVFWGFGFDFFNDGLRLKEDTSSNFLETLVVLFKKSGKKLEIILLTVHLDKPKIDLDSNRISINFVDIRSMGASVTSFSNGSKKHNWLINDSKRESSVIIRLDNEKQLKYFTRSVNKVIEQMNNSSTTKPSSKGRKAKPKRGGSKFVSPSIITQLKKLDIDKDQSKLVKLCEELNDNFSRKNYYSTIFLIRCILDHVPPLFGKSRFNEISNNYVSRKGTREQKKSFGKLMDKLSSDAKNLADEHIHKQIMKNHVHPSKVQVDFSNSIDRLLAEIIEIHK